MTTKVPAELSSTPSIVDNGDATAITINSDENVGIGTSTIDTTYSGYVGLELGAQAVINGNRTTGDTGVTSIGQNAYLSSASGGSWKYKESGKAALIQAVDDGSIRFYTTDTTGSADDALTWSERARFLSSGGLAFNGDTAAANALDDYEEGEHNPTITAGSGTPSIASAENTLSYTKIGNKVFINGQLGGCSASGCSGTLSLTMPFAGAAQSERADFYFGTASTNNNDVAMFILTNTANTNVFTIQVIEQDGTKNSSSAAFMASKGSFDINFAGFHYTTT